VPVAPVEAPGLSLAKGGPGAPAGAPAPGRTRPGAGLARQPCRGGGDRLGPVGGRIVAEVLIGLLRADPASYLRLEPDWEPTLLAAGPGFGLADLLTLGIHRDGSV
jgi:hypothetical protein